MDQNLFRCNRQESIALACVRGKDRMHQVRQTQGCSSGQYHVFSLSTSVLLLLILPDLRRVFPMYQGKWPLTVLIGLLPAFRRQETVFPLGLKKKKVSKSASDWPCLIMCSLLTPSLIQQGWCTGPAWGMCPHTVKWGAWFAGCAISGRDRRK